MNVKIHEELKQTKRNNFAVSFYFGKCAKKKHVLATDNIKRYQA
jgi:hypothetical protein